MLVLNIEFNRRTAIIKIMTPETGRDAETYHELRKDGIFQTKEGNLGKSTSL